MAWKSKYKGSEIESLLDTIVSGAIKGGGIEIVDSVDKLDPNAELGSMASVVTAGTLQEISFRDLYQADASILDTNTYTLNTENCSLVGGLSITPPSAPIESSSNVLLAFSTANMSLMSPIAGDIMVQLQFVPNADNTKLIGLGGMMMDIATQSETNYTLFSINDDGSVTVNQDQIDALNDVFANNELYYLGTFMYAIQGTSVPSDFYDVVDTSIQAVSGIPSKAHVYLKKDNWEELYAKDFEKLNFLLQKTNANISNLREEIPTKISQLENDTDPIYTTIAPNYVSNANLSGSMYEMSHNHIYMCTVPCDNEFYLNISDWDSEIKNITLYFFSIGYNIKIRICSSERQIEHTFSFVACPSLYKFTFEYSRYGNEYSIWTSHIEKSLSGIVYEGILKQGLKTNNSYVPFYINGQVINRGETFDTEGSVQLLALDTNFYYPMQLLDVNYPVNLYLNDWWNVSPLAKFKINKLYLGKTSYTLPAAVTSKADEIHIYSLEDWVQKRDDTSASFKNGCTLYIQENLWDFHIPDSVKIIQDYTLKGLEITNIYFDGMLPSYNSDSFKSTNIHVKSLNHILYGRLKSSESVLPNGSGNIFFENMTNKLVIIGHNNVDFLRYVMNYNTVIIRDCNTIASYAFDGSGIEKVIIQNVDQIEVWAFSNCANAQYYDFSRNEAIPHIVGQNVFLNMPSTCKIIVPDNLYDEWIAATNWSTYASYIIKKSDWDASQTTE